MKKALIIMNEDFVDKVYDKEARREIDQYFEVLSEPLTSDNCLNHPDLLEEVEVIFSGWGAPKFDKAFLDAAPNLEAIFYAAGTMKSVITDAVWDRDLVITTSNSVNAIPVAEYTLSQILFSLKNGWQITRKVREERSYTFGQFDVPGAYKKTVGIITFSQIGQKTIELLQNFDLNIVAHHYIKPSETVNKYNVPLVSLEELFKVSDVVSLHSPLLPDTEGMITGELFRSMKENATFINTARGAIVKENEMIKVLKERPDLTAILDVTEPEPPVPESPLYDMDNVVLTPHIAGSLGSEVGRMGKLAAEEAARYAKNEPLKFRIDEEQYNKMA